MHRPPVVAPQHRYLVENNHRQPRTTKERAASSSCMAPSPDSEPSEERAPEDAGTSSESDDQQAATTAAAARPKSDEPAAEAENKKDNRSAAEDNNAGAGSCFGAVDPARRPSGPSCCEESARERLKRHRTEMAGRVRIPDMWGQERLLKDWVDDCAVFDRPLAATAGLLNARDALVAQQCAAARPSTAPGRTLRVQNGCS